MTPVNDANSDRDRDAAGPSGRADRRAARRAALERRQVSRRGEASDPVKTLVEVKEGPSLGELVEPLIDGLVQHAGKHLALLKYEVVSSAEEVRRDLFIAAVSGGAVAIGYVLFNATVALAFGALWGGLLGVAAGLGVLSLLHLALGGLFVARSVRRLKQSQIDLSLTRAEIEREARWLKEIKEPKALPSPEAAQKVEAP